MLLLLPTRLRETPGTCNASHETTLILNIHVIPRFLPVPGFFGDGGD